MTKKLTLCFLSLAIWAGIPLAAAASEQHAVQQITLAQETKIPGATLQPGNYTFKVEDQLHDRAIVRITNSADNSHYLVLAVPNPDLKPAVRKGIRLFSNKSEATLEAWAYPGSKMPLEFVYPKLEAVKITADSGDSALAVDPPSDNLTENLSPDDMKIVTLWLLSPKRVTASHHGEGVSAAHYSAPASTTLMAKADTNREKTAKTLPKTAGSTFMLGLVGMLALGLGAAIRFGRRLPFIN